VAVRKVRTERRPAGRSGAGRPRKYSDDILVSAALRVMEREGYRALSLRSLAAELKTSHTTLYNYVDAIEEIESRALDRLSQKLPVPRAAAGPVLRAELVDYLKAARSLLLQHPGVMLSPPDSAAGKSLNAISHRWQEVLQATAPDPNAGRLALTLLTSAAITTAIRDLVFKADPRAKNSRTSRQQETELLDQFFGELIDFLLPGLIPAGPPPT
jgi:AcrR family transcriptional regulator